MIVCEDVIVDPKNRKRFTLVNALDRVPSGNDPPYPYRLEKLGVFAQLTECREGGTVRLEIQEADTNKVILKGPDQTVMIPNNPLAVHFLRFRVRKCDFPAPGLYWVQFFYNDRLLTQQPLVLC